MIEIVSVGSSSAGNSYIIRAGEAVLLLDAGLSARKIVSALDDCGLSPEDVDAVLITHEHIDHVRSIRAIAGKCCNAEVYASSGTIAGCDNFCYVPEERLNIVCRGDSFIVSGKDSEAKSPMVRCFALSHDAREPIGYSIICDGEQLTVVTDTGIITDEIFGEMKTADMLVFEANHEEQMLMYGPYPYNVKQRIKSDYGHLSNVTAGEILASLIRERLDACKEASEEEGPAYNTAPEIMLAHLSDKNNTPYQARLTIEDILHSNGYERDEHYSLSIAAREGLTGMKTRKPDSDE